MSRKPTERQHPTDLMTMRARERPADVQVVRLRFGSVELEAAKPDPAAVRRNVARGHEALAGAMGVLKQPGVKLAHAAGVPLYAVDPDRPELIVRELDGRRDRGTFVDGMFQVVP